MIHFVTNFQKLSSLFLRVSTSFKDFYKTPVYHFSSHPQMFLRKSVLKIYRKFTREHPCRSVISIKLLSNFIEIAFWYGCSPVHLLHIFRTPFPRNTSGWLLLPFGNNFEQYSKSNIVL